MKEEAIPLRTLRVIALAKISVYQSKWPWPLNYWPESLYTERKKKRIFWLSKHWIYYKNKFCLDTSNWYPLIPTVKFLNNFFFIFVGDVFHLPWRHCHVYACTEYTWRKKELKNKSQSKKIDRWIIFRLKSVSLLTNNDNSWPTFPICNRFRWNEYKILFIQWND